MNKNSDNIIEKEKQLFNKEYYKLKNSDLDEKQISFEHYHKSGWKEGRDPNEWFSTNYYLNRYPDIKKANVDPFYHYLKIGIKENRVISDSLNQNSNDNSEVNVIELNFVKKYFDRDFYVNTYPDIKQISDPLLHYYLYGWKEGRDPSDFFSTTMFFIANKIIPKYCPVIIAELFPKLKKFISRNQYTIKSNNTNYKTIYSKLVLEYKEEIDVCEKYIDNEYYCLKYGIKDQAAEHYCIFGYKLDFNPNSWFDTKNYKKNCLEINSGNINPLYHYVKKGHYSNPIISPIVNGKYKLHKGVPLCISNAIKHYIQYITSPETTTKQYNDISYNLIRDCLNDLYLKEKSNKLSLEWDKFSNILLEKIDIQNLHRETDFTLHWIIPDFGIGGGGHMTIFRAIKYLEVHDWTCKIWIINKLAHNNEYEAYDDLIKFYQILRAEINFLSMEKFPTDGAGIICTSWETVEWGLKIKRNQKIFYFIQDYEKLFYAMGSKYLLAEETYSKDVNCICASPWLNKIMTEVYKRNSCYFMLGYNTDEYKIIENFPKFSLSDNKKHIAVYSRIFTERRAVELIIVALHILANERNDFIVHLFGGGLELETAPFDYVIHGTLTSDELCKLYNGCDLGICFSTTNYSLVPQEMMACGLPLLEHEGENTTTIFPSDIISLAKPNPENIAQKISYMLDNPNENGIKASKAYNWVKKITWDESFKTIERFIAKTTGFKVNDIMSKNSKNQIHIKASVVIPIYNPDSKFITILNKVCNQQCPWNYEVILIDSSNDQSIKSEIYKEISNKIRLYKIDPKEFQHGRTRNKGVELSRGEFVAFITQDAMPYDYNWLYNLVTVLEKDDKLAIAFGRHFPYEDASPFVKRDIINHFNNILKESSILDKYTKTDLYNAQNENWLQMLYFYSDNNSCLKKEFWKKIPMRNVEYGEDQLLAKDMIDAGYKKAYVHQASVYHSHNFNEEQTQVRAKIEKHFFEDYFGWNIISQYKKPEELEQVLNKIDKEFALKNNISNNELSLRYKLNKAKAIGCFS